jgi:tetratricopeptide (TPR) repeat protein
MSLFDGDGGGPSLSAHADILSVTTPTTSSSLHALIEEIKRRGRTAVSSRDLRGAEALYTKGIDTLLSTTTTATNTTNDVVDTDEYTTVERKKDIAILRSNRSLVRLQMNNAIEALDDAQKACLDDPTYIKAYWRLGQAYVATSNGKASILSEAVSAFEKALVLDMSNKALAKEVTLVKEKLRLATELEAAVAEDEAEEMKLSEDFAMTMMKQKKSKSSTELGTTNASKSQQQQQQQEPSTKDGTAMDVEEDPNGDVNDLFTKSDHVRGYKIRSDGKKTSYFHREIDDETKKLIGDIAPKKLGKENNTYATSSAVDSIAAQQQQQEGTSAWNKAGTWEERDVTPWAKESLTMALLSCKYILPNGSPSPGSTVVVYEIGKLDGSASYAAVRGKKRYIYEFALTVKWEFTLFGEEEEEEEDGKVVESTQQQQQCRGEMTFPDIDGTVEVGEGYDIVNYSVDGSTCVAGIGPLLERFVRDGGLRDIIHEAIDNWVKLFRATY